MIQDRKLLLIVEDHEPTRRVLSNILTRRGWEVLKAGTVEEGLALLAQGPRCVILDLMLPDGSGETILRHVRDLQLGIRVIVCTATNDESRLDEVRRLGPEVLLLKPIDLDAVLIACQEPEAA